MEMRLATLLIIFSVIASAATAQPQPQRFFKCTSSATCHSLIEYVSPNATTLSDIRTLFEIKNFHSILGANSMPLSTTPNQSVEAKQRIKIPFHCRCTNGIGISDKRPIYNVKDGDDLDRIARDVFSELVTYQQIAAVNSIPDPSKIFLGQKLWIPLPCSCDDVGGEPVVHFGHMVAPGSTVEQIALEYGTTEQTLLTLNGLANASQLMADTVLDVPLKVCTSTINNNSLDYPLLVPNGTYTFTANNCVQCKCESSTNLKLQCEPSPQKFKVSNWPQCPSVQCEGANNLSIGNTSSSTGCERTTCTYNGYTNQTILTTLINDSTCTGGAPVAQPSDNFATKIGLQGSSWSWLFLSVHLVLLCFSLLL